MFESPRISWEVRLRSKARDVSPEKKLAGREKIECGSRVELMLWVAFMVCWKSRFYYLWKLISLRNLF